MVIWWSVGRVPWFVIQCLRWQPLVPWLPVKWIHKVLWYMSKRPRWTTYHAFWCLVGLCLLCMLLNRPIFASCEGSTIKVVSNPIIWSMRVRAVVSIETITISTSPPLLMVRSSWLAEVVGDAASIPVYAATRSAGWPGADGIGSRGVLATHCMVLVQHTISNIPGSANRMSPWHVCHGGSKSAADLGSKLLCRNMLNHPNDRQIFMGNVSGLKLSRQLFEGLWAHVEVSCPQQARHMTGKLCSSSASKPKGNPCIHSWVHSFGITHGSVSARERALFIHSWPGEHTTHLCISIHKTHLVHLGIVLSGWP